MVAAYVTVTWLKRRATKREVVVVLDTHSTESAGHRQLVSGPVAAFLDRSAVGDDPATIAARVRDLEDAFRHWVTYAAPYATLIDTSAELICELMRMVADLNAEAQSAHAAGEGVVDGRADRRDRYDAWTPLRTSRSAQVDALLERSGEWLAVHRRRFSDDRS